MYTLIRLILTLIFKSGLRGCTRMMASRRMSRGRRSSRSMRKGWAL